MHVATSASRQQEGTRPRLYGRDGQLAALDRLVRDSRKGHGGTVLLHGDRGVGKSALLHHLRTAARGVRMIRVDGTGSETRLPYAALHRALTPLRGHLGALPARRRETVEAVAELRTAELDPLDVGLAVRSLLAAAAAEEPVLCLFDDAHLLDGPSREGLAVAARRAGDDRVACVFALPRADDCPELAAFPRLHLSGLADRDALALLRDHLPSPLDPSLCERIVADAHGNPQALLAVPRALSPTEMVSVRPTAPGRPGGWSPRGWMRGALEGLRDPARQVLLVAAAEPSGDTVTVLRAVEALGLHGADVTETESSGLVEFGPTVRFAHPLLRTTVYARASLAQRRQAHGALAATCDALRSPEQLAWHRGQAATTFDEGTAAQLQAAAERRLRRHEARTAATLLELAALLTDDRRQRALRLMASATAWRRSGELRHALDLLARLQLAALPGTERAEATSLHAWTQYSVHRDAAAARALDEAAEHARTHDRQHEGVALLEALTAIVLAGRQRSAEALPATVAKAYGFSTGLTAARPHEELLEAIATHTLKGYAPAVEPMRRAVHAYLSAPAHLDLDISGSWLACHTAVGVWDAAAWRALADRRTAAARRLGAVTALPWGLTHQALADVHGGDLARARARVAEAERVSEAIGAAPLGYAALTLAAWSGREGSVEALATVGAKDAAARDEGRLLTAAEYARAVLYNSQGHYRKAFEACAAAARLDELALRNWLLPELLEAAVRTQHRQEACDTADRLAECARLTGSHWATGLHLRARALLSDGDGAEDHYRDSVRALTAAGALLQAGRTQLLWGEWLRRQGRMSAARVPLRAAFDVFDRAGAVAFARRCAGELAAAGARPSRSTSGEPAALTAQERRIARRVARGDTSKEVAAALFLSPRTVDAHLRSIFRKLGISSRRQLRDRSVLPDGQQLREASPHAGYS
ncbi:AAA family ATPase [Streptomyces sp. NPDC057794]|uniref:AAA family ATPase n=1 Tax=Streptomyces sp. NPDC057794 TaxID=3346251 RepID=UPI0036A9BC55